MKNKSIVKNGFLNGLKNGINVLFPLITFPYVTRVLNVESLGAYNFAFSFINYFILLAGLGIASYSVREGSKLRNDRDRFNEFASSVFTINIFSTIISYMFLAICLLLSKNLQNHTSLILMFSIQILFTTLGVEWIYSIYEEYLYITLRSIVFKIISILLIFFLVRTEKDTLKYAGITVFSIVGSNILNIINSKKYCKLVIKSPTECRVHLKPILVLFASSVAVMIYVYSDITMLGFMKGNYVVGIYSVSSKIYTIIKTLLSSIIIVSIPRCAMYHGQGKLKEFCLLVQKIYDILMIMVLPAVTGMFILSDRIILLIAGKEYIRASTSLRILCIALVFCIAGWIFNQCVLLPCGKEKMILKATMSSATINIVLNVFLIPIMSEDAAALTTALSEFLMMLICGYYGMKECRIRLINKNILSTVCGCLGITFSIVLFSFFARNLNNLLFLVTIIIISVLVYYAILMFTKNEILRSTIKFVSNKLVNNS